MNAKQEKLGIIAGGGDLVKILIDYCLAIKRDFVVVAIEGNAHQEMIAPNVAHKWVRIGQAGSGFKYLADEKVKEIIMIGTIRRPSLSDLVPDLRTASFFARIGFKSLGDDGILRAVVSEIEKENMRVVGIHEVMPELLVKEGILTKQNPDKQAEADILRGVQVAMCLGKLDVGQSVVVQQGLVLGVEGIEGTDKLIERCGAYQRKGLGGVLVKLRKPQQDMRIDLPTIGTNTIENLHRQGMRGLAVHAGNALIVNEKEVIALANKYKMFIKGIVPQESN